MLALFYLLVVFATDQSLALDIEILNKKKL